MGGDRRGVKPQIISQRHGRQPAGHVKTMEIAFPPVSRRGHQRQHGHRAQQYRKRDRHRTRRMSFASLFFLRKVCAYRRLRAYRRLLDHDAAVRRFVRCRFEATGRLPPRRKLPALRQSPRLVFYCPSRCFEKEARTPLLDCDFSPISYAILDISIKKPILTHSLASAYLPSL